MIAYNIQDIASVLKGELIKNSGGKISYLAIDSRKVLFARETLFFALQGYRNDGHFFLADLYKSGVRNFIVQNYPNDIDNFPRANFVKVENSFNALQALVSWHRTNIEIPVIGVTGSNGKTIVKEWIYQCLSKNKYIIRNPKSYNSQVGVPLSVWLLNPEADMGVFEAGISEPNEMQRLQKIIKPTIGIFTNIGDAHQENFESIDQKLSEKLTLFKDCKTLIYCADNNEISSTIATIYPNIENTFTWSTTQQSNLRITKITHSANKSKIEALHNNELCEVIIPFADKASVENAMQVWCLLLVFGYSNKLIIEKLSQLEPVAMRLEVKEGTNNCTIINDSYNSDIESLHIALDFLSYQNQHPQKLIVLSDIAQSGYDASNLYSQVSDMIQQKQLDRLIGIGPEISKYKELFELRSDFFNTTQEFLKEFDFSKINNMSVLLKGARSFEFETISRFIQKQTHRTVLEIDLNALSYNLDYFKKLLKPQTGIIAMLKASGYGSGTHEVANICQYQRVAVIAVAFPDEGIELRKSGIKIPILIMNPEEEGFFAMIENNLEPQISNFDSLRLFDKIAEKSENNPYPVHIKLDTGMHRSGFMKDELDALIEELKKTQNIRVKTIFSHLSSADEPGQDDFTLEQIETFTQMSNTFMAEFPYKIKRHILNSAGIERFPKYQFDFIRLGIGLFGISTKGKKLAPVGTLSSSIIQIKNIKAGQTIGYGRKGIAKRDSIIATVPIGYADGLRRILSNGVGKMWINGKLAPIIGNVCMDMCMIDITTIEAKEGDRVEFFGKNLSVSQIAKWMDTIPYEVLTGISKRVKRTYQFE
ncbi:MAG: bifunctional UDP-N-acetylmuramoyl-tripeptide:D-alanyl-D-alanine ligase/alanine racemase [Salinivirgaceae bacterium]|jgi:alanine racemase|nr:bifunctional UDP-N-acetylmuramoyl-tripeptide:D-alanyl-D-alanine ligase/alanine racemase [Salinivirgaceae bacterium]